MNLKKYLRALPVKKSKMILRLKNFVSLKILGPNIVLAHCIVHIVYDTLLKSVKPLFRKSLKTQCKESLEGFAPCIHVPFD